MGCELRAQLNSMSDAQSKSLMKQLSEQKEKQEAELTRLAGPSLPPSVSVIVSRTLCCTTEEKERIAREKARMEEEKNNEMKRLTLEKQKKEEELHRLNMEKASLLAEKDALAAEKVCASSDCVFVCLCLLRPCLLRAHVSDMIEVSQSVSP